MTLFVLISVRHLIYYLAGLLVAPIHFPVDYSKMLVQQLLPACLSRCDERRADVVLFARMAVFEVQA